MENRILIIKTGALGDVLRTTVLLEGLIEKFVHPKITWITNKNADALLQNNPYIYDIYYEDELPEIVFTRTYSLIISLEENEKLLQQLNKLRYKELFGVYLAPDRKISYTHNSAMWYDMSLISRFPRQTADELKKRNLFSYPELLYKMLDMPWRHQRYKLFLIKRDLTYAAELRKQVSDHKPTIGIFVGAGERWQMKALPQDIQERLIRKLLATLGDNAQILLLTGPSELELGITSQLQEKYPSLITHDVQTLEQFVGVIHMCDIIISPDSLAMHIGVALNKYVVTYFTVTSASEIEIYTGKKIVATHPDYSSYTKELKPRPNITDDISVEDLVQSVKEILYNTAAVQQSVPQSGVLPHSSMFSVNTIQANMQNKNDRE